MRRLENPLAGMLSRGTFQPKSQFSKNLTEPNALRWERTWKKYSIYTINNLHATNTELGMMCFLKGFINLLTKLSESSMFSGGTYSTFLVSSTKLFTFSISSWVNFESSYFLTKKSFKIFKCIIKVEHENLIFVNYRSVVRVLNFMFFFGFLRLVLKCIN